MTLHIANDNWSQSARDGEYVPSLPSSVSQNLGLEMYLLLCETGGDHTMLVHHDKIQELSPQGHKSKFNLEYGLFELMCAYELMMIQIHEG